MPIRPTSGNFVLLAAMGWSGYHLHQFVVADVVTFAMPDEDSDWAIDERKVTLDTPRWWSRSENQIHSASHRCCSTAPTPAHRTTAEAPEGMPT